MRPADIIRRAPAAAVLLLSACMSAPAPEVGVVRGADEFVKEVFFDGSGIGNVQSISAGRLDRDSLDVVIVCGTTGAAIISPKGKLRRTVGFDRPAGRTTALDIDRDFSPEFMGRGGDGLPVSLFNSQGQTIWEMSVIDSRKPADMTAFDLDGDGILEFIVALSGNGGIRIMNDTATERAKWEAGNTGCIEAADIDRDGRPEILHGSVKKPGIVIRDAAGKTLRTIGGVGGPFALCRRISGESSAAILASVQGKKTLRLVGFDGILIREFPVAAEGRHVSAAVVRFAPGEPPCIAVSLTLKTAKERSLFTVFDGGGKAVYEEIFPAAFAAAAAVPGGAAGAEVLLVGAGGRVWKYSRSGTGSGPAR